MKYRKLSPNGDYVFGHGAGDFLVDRPEAVAQAVQTRLRLWLGDWFLDNTEGTDWRNGVLGVGTAVLFDLTIRDRISQTDGVVSIDAYASQRNADTRSLSVQVTITTAYGQAEASVTLGSPVLVAENALLGADGAVLLGADGQILTAPDPAS